MNFDSSHIREKKKAPRSRRISRKISLYCLRALLVCFLFAGVVAVAGGYGALQGLTASAPSIDTLSVAPSESATYIYNSQGQPVQKLSESTSNRTLVELSQIPSDLQHAVIAVEDERFYEHSGIDMRGILRAGLIGITTGNFSEGASTITQQLIKNNVFTDWMTQTSLIQKFRRKFQEQYLAMELEEKMTKDQILENYLNTINLGAGAYGVQAAAKRYFNKDVCDLTLSESTVIAGITQNPTLYNPIENPQENAERRTVVLEKMLDQGYITQAEMDEALADDVYARIQTTAQEEEETSIYSYYTDALIDQVMEDLMEQKGYTQQQAYKLLYTGGLKIYSNQDEEIQAICDEEFADDANYPAETKIGLDYALSIQHADGEIVNYSTDSLQSWFQSRDDSFNLMFDDEASAREAARTYREAMTTEGDTVLAERVSLVPQPQASVVIIENETGYVKALVGGRGEKEASLTLNRATESRRQPGSTFKILTTYAPALEEGGMTLATAFDNEPYAYSNGVSIRNGESSDSYCGYMTIRDAIAASVNVVAVKCITEITPELGLSYAEKFGITTLYEDLDAIQPLALGGVTDGVVNIELCDAYAAIANGGQYNEAKFYSRIEDAEGNVLIDNEPVSKTVISESTAYLLTQAMTDVVGPGGTASDISVGEMAVAGKTGTTSDDCDVWFAGYTPYYTCTVWGGYDNHDSLPENGTTYHKKLWNAIMQRVHEDLPVIREFEQPDDIVTATVCRKSGLLEAKGLCSEDPRGSMVYTEYFAKGTVPTETCDLHVAVSVCTETGLLATDTCDATLKVYFRRPADSTGTTDDSAYAPPSSTCAGHVIIEETEDLLDPDEEVPDLEEEPEGEPEAEQPIEETEEPPAEEPEVTPETESAKKSKKKNASGGNSDGDRVGGGA